MRKTTLLFLILTACSPPPTPTEANDVQPIKSALTLPIGATGHYDATLTWFKMENTDIDALLPPELERIPAGGGHKTLVALLHQHYIDILQPGAPAPSPGWDELTLYFVNLQLKAGNHCIAHFGAQGPFSYLPIMHVTSPGAIFVGNAFFGLNQHLASTTRTSTTWHTDSLDPLAPLTYDATFSHLEPVSSCAQDDLAQLESFLSAPTIGKVLAGSGSPFPVGTLIQHQVDWHFTDPTAVITSLESHITASSPQLGASFHRNTDGINSDEHGSFRIVAPFDSSQPDPCF
jgi:hypothetical protein